MTIAGGAPESSSPSTRVRPSSGGTRATRKADAVIAATSTASDWPSSVIRVRGNTLTALKSSIDVSASRQVAKSYGVARTGRFSDASQFLNPTTSLHREG